MNHSRLVLLFALVAGLLSGCQSVPANKPAITYAPPPPTSLIVTVEADGMTEDEYKARRDELIAYLIDRGYIQSEADLVADSASAGRIINATLGADGGFKLSVYNLDSEAVADPTVVATYSIPTSYYGDYYYYGFAPIPFYGYSSWPAYYPIYPTYPVCLPPKPVAPFCPPRGSYSHHAPFPKPTPYVYCTPQSRPANNWVWNQSYPGRSNHNRYGRGDSEWQRRSNQPTGRPELASASTNTPAAAPGARTWNRGNRHQDQAASPRTASTRNTAAPGTSVNTPLSPAPDRVRPESDQRTAGQNVRRYYPDRRPDNVNWPSTPNTPRTAGTVPNTTRNPNSDQRQRPPSASPRANFPDSRNTANAPATMPNTARISNSDQRSPNSYPRANTSQDQRPRPPSANPRPSNPENRNTASRPTTPDSRPRNYNPERSNNSPRPANVATNTRPSPAPSQRHESAPRSAPAPRYDSPSQNNSNSSSSSSHTAQSVRDGSTSRQPVER